jgi:hypothetical protein
MSPNFTPNKPPLEDLTEQDLREMYLQKKSKLIRYGLMSAIGVLILTLVLVLVFMPGLFYELLKNKD